MPNLQELLPFYTQLFQQWSELTLNNGPYAIFLGLTVWFITAMGYSISLSLLKAKFNREVKARAEAQTSLEACQQQLQQSQLELAAVSEQLALSKQEASNQAERATNLEQQLVSGRKQLTDNIAALVERFELIDNAAPQAGADSNALWQHFSSILGRVGERFQNEQQAKARLQLDIQAEKTKLAEKEVALAGLQASVDQYSHRISELERTAAELQNLHQELEHQKQRLLIAHDKHRVDSARIAELEKGQGQTHHSQSSASAVQPEFVAPAAVVAQPAPAVVEPVAKLETVIAEPKPAPVPVEPETSTVVNQPLAVEPSPATATKSAGKWKGMFGNAMERFAKMDEKLGSPTTVKVKDEAVVETVADPVEQVAEPVIEKTIVDAEQPVAKSGKSAGFANKLGGMLGGLKKAPAQPVDEPEAVIEQPVLEVAEPEPTSQKPGKLGGLLGKFRK